MQIFPGSVYHRKQPHAQSLFTGWINAWGQPLVFEFLRCSILSKRTPYIWICDSKGVKLRVGNFQVVALVRRSEEQVWLYFMPRAFKLGFDRVSEMVKNAHHSIKSEVSFNLLQVDLRLHPAHLHYSMNLALAPLESFDRSAVFDLCKCRQGMHPSRVEISQTRDGFSLRFRLGTSTHSRIRNGVSRMDLQKVIKHCRRSVWTFNVVMILYLPLVKWYSTRNPTGKEKQTRKTDLKVWSLKLQRRLW